MGGQGEVCAAPDSSFQRGVETLAALGLGAAEESAPSTWTTRGFEVFIAACGINKSRDVYESLEEKEDSETLSSVSPMLGSSGRTMRISVAGKIL